LTQSTQREEHRGHGEHEMLKIGQKAPDFTLKTDTGSEISLKDFKDHRVVIFFFPKANTPG